MAEHELLFRVFVGGVVSGHEYRIYTNGRTEGFGDDVQIVNYYPLLLSEAINRYIAESNDETTR
jgi:hypothetical protein